MLSNTFYICLLLHTVCVKIRKKYHFCCLFLHYKVYLCQSSIIFSTLTIKKENTIFVKSYFQKKKKKWHHKTTKFLNRADVVYAFRRSLILLFPRSIVFSFRRSRLLSPKFFLNFLSKLKNSFKNGFLTLFYRGCVPKKSAWLFQKISPVVSTFRRPKFLSKSQQAKRVQTFQHFWTPRPQSRAGVG